MVAQTKIVHMNNYFVYNRYPASHRILHWFIAIDLVFILFTILLKYTAIDIITNFFIDSGINTKKSVIEELVLSSIWTWHIIAGYILSFLYYLRIICNIKREREMKSNKISTEKKFKRILYCVFYILNFLSLITGLYMVNSKNENLLVLNIHSFSLYYTVGFIVIHIIGVMIDEIFYRSNIVSKMINGEN